MVWIAAAIVLLAVFLLRKRKLAVWVILAVSAIGGTIWYFTETDSRRQSDERAALTVTASATGQVCVDPTLPIAIEFTNNSDRTINRVSLDLTGTVDGRPAIVYRASLRDDQIIRPGQVVTRCHRLLIHGFSHPRPQIIDATQYQWSVKATLVSFTDTAAE